MDDLNRVSNMVSVAVSNQKNIHALYFLLGSWASRVVHDPGIDDDRLACGGLNAEGRVPQPGEFDAFQIHGENKLLAIADC